MSDSVYIKPTPWDQKVFSCYTAEITEYSEQALMACVGMSGMFTLKIDPLTDKSLAHAHGFYYCDTLLTPECTRQNLKAYSHSATSIDKNASLDELLVICDAAFSHGRFHRDFNLDKKKADARYNQWLADLYQHGQVFSLRAFGKLAGFIACRDNELQLHAVASDFRSKGLAKYWWTLTCAQLFEQGHQTVRSSVSASNLAVVNLYSRLGFNFTSAVDIYHKVIEE